MNLDDLRAPLTIIVYGSVQVAARGRSLVEEASALLSAVRQRAASGLDALSPSPESA